MVGKTILVDLKAAADGIGVQQNPNLLLHWEENVKGHSALKVQPVEKEFQVDDKWVLLFNAIQFEEAIVEFDALGQSGPPQSNFLGVAFHATDDMTHDAVYFRPFNFRAEDPIRRIHAVEYVSHPEYPWFDLRRDMPGQYEKPVLPAPDGDSWFHAKIEIRRPTIRAFVEHSDQASLVVNELISRKETSFGLWCGPGVGGYFANLKVTILK
jgi:hypothetical protein